MTEGNKTASWKDNGWQPCPPARHGGFAARQSKELFPETNIELIPSCMMASEGPVGEGTPANWKREVAADYKVLTQLYVCLCYPGFEASVLQASDPTYDEQVVTQMPTVHYEFPNGYTCDSGAEPLKVPEELFDPSNGKGYREIQCWGSVPFHYKGWNVRLGVRSLRQWYRQEETCQYRAC